METTVRLMNVAQETLQERYAKINDLIESYRGKEGSIIPVLHIAHGIYGELTTELLQFIADRLELPYTKVRGIAAFYAGFAVTQTCRVSQDSREDIYKNIREIILDYRGIESGLIPVLHIVQGIYGHFTPELLQIIAETLEMPLSKVTGVAAFYPYYKLTAPGEYTIRVCMGSSCYQKGAPEVLRRLKEQLGIEVGETTPDGKFSLEVVRCIGQCDRSPGISVNNSTAFTRVKADDVGKILSSF